MAYVNCKVCGKQFYTKPSHQKLGFGKYCSMACSAKDRFSGKYVECFICGHKVYRQRAALSKSRSGKYFCGKSCQTVWRNSILFVGPNHSNWKNGESTYRRILINSKAARKCILCGIENKKILTVHHIDKNRKNNSEINLAWLCFNCHYLVHHDKSAEKKFMVAMV